MAEEQKTPGQTSTPTVTGNEKRGEKPTESNNRQNSSFQPGQYGNDPGKMANYTGNYGEGTYDTDYGAGSFPQTNKDEQGENWISRIGNRKEKREEGHGKR